MVCWQVSFYSKLMISIRFAASYSLEMDNWVRNKGLLSDSSSSFLNISLTVISNPSSSTIGLSAILFNIY